MLFFRLLTLIFGLAACAGCWADAAPIQKVNQRDAVVMETVGTMLVVNLHGGCTADFHLNGESSVNPLNWTFSCLGDEPPDYSKEEPAGHFICLDRWGPVSDLEAAAGMPAHGEAWNTVWDATSLETLANGSQRLTLGCELPLAGLKVRRTILLDGKFPVAYVQEEITNTRILGRVFNLVQHATIGPPFLNESTIVDCNVSEGFSYDCWPNVQENSFTWPFAENPQGKTVDLRRLTDSHDPGVTSFVFPDDVELGWATALSPKHRLLVGYVFRTEDYPWFNVWRNVKNGEPSARGLEFGTTGGHQAFAELVKKGQVLGRNLFEWIDPNETVVKDYLLFLQPIPDDAQGVSEVLLADGAINVHLLGSKAPLVVGLADDVRQQWLR